jgi:hypothetical protein
MRAKAAPASAFGPDQMLDLAEAAALIGVSKDTLKRHYRHFIRQLSPGRVGIRMRDALSIGDGNTTAA